VLLSIASLGLLIAAFFPTDIESAPSIRAGDIHNLLFLVNVVSIILSMVFLTVSFRSHPWWRAYQGVAIALTSIVVIAFFIQFFTLRRGAPYGLTNRLFVIVLFVWLFATSIRLRRLTRK
jgi:multidrug transporter EmrE-like cation transporter